MFIFHFFCHFRLSTCTNYPELKSTYEIPPQNFACRKRYIRIQKLKELTNTWFYYVNSPVKHIWHPYNVLYLLFMYMKFTSAQSKRIKTNEKLNLFRLNFKSLFSEQVHSRLVMMLERNIDLNYTKWHFNIKDNISPFIFGMVSCVWLVLEWGEKVIFWVRWDFLYVYFSRYANFI